MDSQTHELHRVRNDLNKELHHWVRCKEINMEMLHWLDAWVQLSFCSRTVKTHNAGTPHEPQSQSMLEIISVVSSWFPPLAVFLWELFFFLVAFLPPAFFFSSLLSWFATQPRFHLFLSFLTTCVALFPNQPSLCIFPFCHCWIVCSPYCIFCLCLFQFLLLSPIPSTNWNILQPACNALSISANQLKSLLFHSLLVRLLGGLHMDLLKTTLLSCLLFTTLSNKGEMPLP